MLAVGGGSPIDMGKLLAVAVPSTRSPREIALTGFAKDPPALPIIAVPTTCGTGSEATHFAVVYVDGVMQEPTQNYSISGTTIDFGEAAHTGARIVIMHGFAD